MMRYRWTILIPYLLVPTLFGVPLDVHEEQRSPVAGESRELEEAADVIVSAGTMKSARAAHTATTLPDGRVLVAGGFTDLDDSVAGAEIYDPTSNTFGATGAMSIPRHSHTATLLADGRVLLVGGYDVKGDYLASAELYEPTSGTFTPAGSLNYARADHTAVGLLDGRVLLMGGVGPGWTFLASVEVFDPTTDRFALTGAMGEPRESQVAVRLSDGRVLVAGGHRGRKSAIHLYISAEVYDPAKGTFSPTGEMTVRRHKHDAVLLPDGRVLVSGGTNERDSAGVYKSVETYDPSTGEFTSAGTMQLARYKHRGTSLVLPDGRVLISGGATQAEIYAPRTGLFVLVEMEAHMAGQFSASALLPDGRVLITGGYGENRGPQRYAWLYQA